ncbi:mitochondrial 37S ribosomal protein nam9 [Naviculisporaceae sp. PSN 640]
MKFRRIARFHGLKRPRVRQTWNKYNLYNLYRLREPITKNKTFFQQKWAAKALTRGYHGEHIKERKWERMFSRRLLSAVDMDPAYLAANDGSELASGRGSGRQTYEAHTKGSEKKITPYMQMIYAPMERRLDQAVFRALFASSARQARQFCVHGAVKVNGVKMKYPGYLLNPGDMFQVDIEKVLFATGKKKDPTFNLIKSAQKSEQPAEEAEEAAESEEPAAEKAAEGEELDEAAQKKKRVDSLKAIRSRAKAILKSSDITAKKKQALRKLMKDVKTAWTTMSAPEKGGASASAKKLSEADQIVDQLNTLLAELQLDPAEKPAADKAKATEQEQDLSGPQTQEERYLLKKLIQEELENPTDPSKPYHTPWQPRPYMSAFAFIPRYLEVNQKICAAVYLRHPVARQGLAEVPTPFPSGVNQLAFNWYLRRG